MAQEQFANNAQTTLNGSINNSVGSLVVTSATGFPSAGNFRIRIDDEIMLVTAVSGTTFTVTRAQESTSGASHSNLATVTHVLTAGALDSKRSDDVYTNVIASRPTAAKDGRLFLPTDGPILFRDNGSAWVPYGRMQRLNTPPSSGWSWVNQASASVVSNEFGELVEQAAGTSTGQINARVRTPQFSTPYTIIMGFIPQWYPLTNCDVLFCFRRNAAGTDQDKIQAYELGRQSAADSLRLAVDKYTNATTFSANFVSLTPGEICSFGGIVWWKLQHDGTNLIWSYSANSGLSWIQLHTVARTSFFSTNDVDQIGFGVRAPSTSLSKSSIQLVSWEEFNV